MAFPRRGADPELASDISATQDLPDANLQSQADEGNPHFQFLYARWLRDHPLSDEFGIQSFEYLEKAALQGHQEASHCFGLLLRDVKGSKPDIDKSIAFLRHSADSGHCESQYELSRLLFLEKGEVGEALMYAKTAADQGHIEAAFCYALLLMSLKDCLSCDEEVLSYLRFAADFGHPQAWRVLSLLLNGVEDLDYLELSARMGDPESQFHIADIFSKIPKQRAKAAQYFKMASDQNDAEALRRYALMQLDGLGVDRDVDGAIENLRNSALCGNRDSQFRVSQLLFDQNRDCDGAIKFLEMAAQNGHNEARYAYGMRLRDGNGVNRNLENGRVYLELAAQNNHRRAQYELGRIFLKDGPDYPRAASYFKLAADQNHTDACFAYSEMLWTGQGIEKNIEESIEYAKKAGNSGSPAKKFEVAHQFDVVIGRPDIAEEYYKLAADRGHDKAQVELGRRLMMGDRDPVNAVRYFKMAADQGYCQGISAYGNALLNGHGIPQNIEEGIRYLQKAADSNDPRLKFEIASILLKSQYRHDLAVQYFKDAADGNILEAKYKYALMIRSGDGIERNHDESNKALEICGDLGDKEMQYDVAITFFLNDHPPDTLRPEVTAQDLSLGHKYLKLAADSGHSRACGFLATLQSLEYGIAQDIDQCLKYAKFAADSGDALGQAMTAFLMFARNENACAERYLQQFTESADLTILQLMSDLCLKSIRSPFNPRMGIICTIAANDRGISEASTLLSTLARQINVSEDDPDWKQKILQAVDEGDPKFWVWLGNHAFDSGAKTIGIHCMLQALAKGNLEAQTVITTLALHSDFTRSELVDLAPRVEELAAAGVTRAQELYGLFLLFGWGLRQNMVRAIGYFKMAESENSALGQWMCGIGAFYGIGMRKDIEAAKCFLRRASRTIGEARFLLVRILIDETKLIDLLKARYSAGKCDDDCEISPDIQEAIDQIRLFADSENNPYLTYVFGFCLELGFGVTRDPEKAFECYDVAAQTVPEAEYRRSLCYRDAVGVPRNLSTAISHLRKAANMGQSDAQWDLAVCLALGIGGKLDEVESLKYLRNSVEGGNVNAGLAVIGIRANFAEKYRGMVFRLAKVIPPPADERPSLYDRRLNSDGDEVGSIAGYWTGWTQFLKFSTHC